MSKDQIIQKLKKGSKWIAAICILAILFNLLCIFRMLGHVRNIADPDPVMTYVLIREFITLGINTVIMTLAAWMFLRISKDGMPFSAGNIWIVRIIGILFLVNAAIPSAVTGEVITPLCIPNYTALIEGLLFLFIAHIIRYGAMLQQESDETL